MLYSLWLHTVIQSSSGPGPFILGSSSVLPGCFGTLNISSINMWSTMPKYYCSMWRASIEYKYKNQSNASLQICVLLSQLMQHALGHCTGAQHAIRRKTHTNVEDWWSRLYFIALIPCLAFWFRLTELWSTGDNESVESIWLDLGLGALRLIDTGLNRITCGVWRYYSEWNPIEFNIPYKWAKEDNTLQASRYSKYWYKYSWNL